MQLDMLELVVVERIEVRGTSPVSMPSKIRRCQAISHPSLGTRALS